MGRREGKGRSYLCTFKWNSLVKKVFVLRFALFPFSPVYFMSNPLPYFLWELPCCLCFPYMHRIRSSFNKNCFPPLGWCTSQIVLPFQPHWCCQIHDQNLSIFFFAKKNYASYTWLVRETTSSSSSHLQASTTWAPPSRNLSFLHETALSTAPPVFENTIYVILLFKKSLGLKKEFLFKLL